VALPGRSWLGVGQVRLDFSPRRSAAFKEAAFLGARWERGTDLGAPFFGVRPRAAWPARAGLATQPRVCVTINVQIVARGFCRSLDLVGPSFHVPVSRPVSDRGRAISRGFASLRQSRVRKKQKGRKGPSLQRKTAVLIANSRFQDAIKYFDGSCRGIGKRPKKQVELSQMCTSVRGRRMFAGHPRRANCASNGRFRLRRRELPRPGDRPQNPPCLRSCTPGACSGGCAR
jgi:hypothetical protein